MIWSYGPFAILLVEGPWDMFFSGSFDPKFFLAAFSRATGTDFQDGPEHEYG